MEKRKLGRTGLNVSPIALGGASFGYVHKSANWDPWSDDGRKTVIATLNHGLELGINYIDTAPLYGAGNSETLIGEVMKTRRQGCVLATKVWFEQDKQGATDSVQESLKRLQTDYIDIVQIHGRMYSAADYEHIVKKGGPLEGLKVLREAGKIGFIGITTEEPWTVLPFLGHPEIDVYQIAYNIGSSAETVGASGVYRGLVLSLSRPAGGFVDNTSALPTTPQPPHRQKRRYHPPPRQASLRLIAADLRVCQEAEQLAAGRVEGALRGVGLTMGEQRPAIVADEGEDDLLDWPPPEVAVHLQSADDLTAESPDVVAVSAQGLA